MITSYSYDEANQLSYDYSPTLRTTYSYNANGNTTLINVGGSVTTYCWDSENRMTRAELPSGGRTTATYDGDGKRRSYADSADFRGLLWDGENIARETDGAGATVAAYSYAPSVYGALLSQRRGGVTSFHHYDALGSTMQLTDASQSPTDSYLYRAFGEQSVLSGSSPNPFTWVGRLGYYRQPDTSDYWVRARVYGPARGRWASRELAVFESFYGYVANSPLSSIDLTGTTPVPADGDAWSRGADGATSWPAGWGGQAKDTPYVKDSGCAGCAGRAGRAIGSAAKAVWRWLNSTGVDPKKKPCKCDWRLMTASYARVAGPDSVVPKRAEIERPAEGPVRLSPKTGRVVSVRPAGGRMPVRGGARIADAEGFTWSRIDCYAVCIDRHDTVKEEWRPSILTRYLWPDALESTGIQGNAWHDCGILMACMADERGQGLWKPPTYPTISKPIPWLPR